MKMVAAQSLKQAQLVCHMFDLDPKEWKPVSICGSLFSQRLTRAVILIGLPHKDVESHKRFEEWLDFVRTKMEPGHTSDVYVITGG